MFMGLLKDLYSLSFYKNLADALAFVLPSFNKQHFISQIFIEDFEHKELKARMRHTTLVLHQFMPADFKEAVKTIEKLVLRLKNSGIPEDGLAVYISSGLYRSIRPGRYSRPLCRRWKTLPGLSVVNLLSGPLF